MNCYGMLCIFSDVRSIIFVKKHILGYDEK